MLTRPQNRWWGLGIKTAKTWGDQPLDHLLPDLIKHLKKNQYRKLNNKIKQAWQILEDETCPQCGIPVWLGHSVLGEIGFEVRRTRCYGCVAKDQASKLDKANETGSTDSVKVVMLDKSTVLSRDKAYAHIEDYVILEADAEQGVPEDERPERDEGVGI